MQILGLSFKDGHYFVDIEGEKWLYDTGSPASFGKKENLILDGKQFDIGNNYMGLNTITLSQFVGLPCAGLLGADIIGQFDHILDSKSETLTISEGELSHDGKLVPMDEFMGIPIISVTILGQSFSMFFDTGAQVSYFQEESLFNFPKAGSFTDFYPGLGQFETEIHNVPVSIGGTEFTFRCGALPDLLSQMLFITEVSGIIGNELLANRTLGYFPRRNALYI